MPLFHLLPSICSGPGKLFLIPLTPLHSFCSIFPISLLFDLLLFFLSLSFQFSNLTPHYFDFSLSQSLLSYSLCIPLLFDPNKWKLIPIDKAIPSGSNDRVSQFLFLSFFFLTWRELIPTCVLFYWPSNYPLPTTEHRYTNTHSRTHTHCTHSCSSNLSGNSVLPDTHQAIH